MKQKRSSKDWIFRINDIVLAIEKIERYTEGLDLAELKKNGLVIDAVVRNFEVIGEAARAVPTSVKRGHADIPWKQMSAMRNLLIHEYFRVDISIIWQTTQKHLPLLKEQLLESFGRQRNG